MAARAPLPQQFRIRGPFSHEYALRHVVWPLLAALTCAAGSFGANQRTTQALSAAAEPAACSSSSGTLALNAKLSRATGISPLLVFFDASGTTDSAVPAGATAFQDVSYSWTFGDTNASGSDSWPYGANAGHNSKNSATGAIAAHLYVTSGSDAEYLVTVTAYDGTNRASCQLKLSAFQPSGAHGFPGKRTTCVAAHGKPAPGIGGCPAGAAVLESASIETALRWAFSSGKRVLFRCGETFSGSYTVPADTSSWSIGAYGGCENTPSNRPVFTVDGGGSALSLNSSNTTTGPVDGRIADIDFEGHGSGLVAIMTTTGFNVKQVTLYNLYANGLISAYYMSGGTQNGIVQSVMTGMTDKEGVYWNHAQNNCLNGSNAYRCGGSGDLANVDYAAMLGNSFDGHGVSTSNTWETVRVGACRLCVFENNTFANASSSGGAVFKLHNGNTYVTQATWLGQYTELVEISDNLFKGSSGAQLVETSPQNGETDERLRNLVLERNLFAGTTAIGRDILVSAVNETLRNNVFYAAGTVPQYGAQVAQRGIEPPAQHVEFFNNTCYVRGKMAACGAFDGTNFRSAGSNSWAKNNLFYAAAGGGMAIVNAGSNNAVASNSTSATADPSMSNASGAFRLISDFTPRASVPPGAPVPVWHDALGTPRSQWHLGAVSAAPGGT